MNELIECIDILCEIQNMANKAKSPKMNNSHQIDIYKLNKLTVKARSLIVKYQNIDFETVEQWEARTGKKYPEDGPIWEEGTTGIYRLLQYKSCFVDSLKIVANENGKPPDYWRPEE